MDLTTAILIAVIAFGIVCISIRILLKRFAAAASNQFHHTHTTPISRLGGVSLAFAFLGIALISFFYFPAGAERHRQELTIFGTALLMFLLGLVDDLKPLGAKKKLAGQIIIASLAYFGGIEITQFKNPFNGMTINLGWIGLPITVLWLVAITNVINLIDGIDGLAGGIGFFLMALLIYATSKVGGLPLVSAVGLCGALLGFLLYNFPPAKIYLGDSGAYFLGFVIGLLSIVSSHKGTITAALVAPAFALALPIIDVCLAILRRGLKGLPMFRPDKKHIHHRLQEMGLSRTRTVLVLYGFSLVFLSAAFAVFMLKEQWLPLVFGVVCFVTLIAARKFDFSREWFSVGKVLGNSLEMRKKTQYTLVFCRWIEMEAERCESIQSLWNDLNFIVHRVGFSKIELFLNDRVHRWVSPSLTGNGQGLQEIDHNLPHVPKMTLKFFADRERMPEKEFELMSELIAESWIVAVKKWEALHRLPVQIPAEQENVSAERQPA